MAMFERLERGARQAFVDATEEASLAGQKKISSEHLLVGLFREPGPAADALAAAGLDLTTLRAWLPRRQEPESGLDAAALASLGIDLDAVRRAAEAAFGAGALDRAATPGQRKLPFADDAKQSLVSAVRLAQQLRQQRISSGHMLIGILDQEQSGAVAALANAGADVATLRADVFRRIAAS
jgi:ATP-dependent Clp protease ATP-binding subunit ClpA